MKKIRLNKLIKDMAILSFGLLSITDGLFVSKDVGSILVSVKYLPLLIIIFIFGVGITSKKIKPQIFSKEIKKLFIIVILFFFISFILQLVNNNYCLNTYSILFKVTIGLMAAYAIVNILNMEDIYSLMKWILFFSIIGYVLEIGLNNLNYTNFNRISYENSFSPFESSYFSYAFLATNVFFSYFRKNKKFMIISCLFTLLSFKRLAIIFTLLLLILPIFININKKINKKVMIFIPILFIFLTIGFHWLLQPQNKELFYTIFNDYPSHFTSGRNERLNLIESNNYRSLGIGSLADMIGTEMIEIDFIEIYIELSIVGLIIFIFLYWSICNGHLYCTLFLIFLFFNHLTAGAFSNSFIWIRNIIIIASIQYLNDGKYLGNNSCTNNYIKE